MRNSIAQGLLGAIIQLQPLPWDDSSVVMVCISNEWQKHNNAGSVCPGPRICPRGLRSRVATALPQAGGGYGASSCLEVHTTGFRWGLCADHGGVEKISEVFVRLTTCKRLTDSVPKLSLITLFSPPETAG